MYKKRNQLIDEIWEKAKESPSFQALFPLDENFHPDVEDPDPRQLSRLLHIMSDSALEELSKNFEEYAKCSTHSELTTVLAEKGMLRMSPIASPGWLQFRWDTAIQYCKEYGGRFDLVGADTKNRVCLEFSSTDMDVYIEELGIVADSGKWKDLVRLAHVLMVGGHFREIYKMVQSKSSVLMQVFDRSVPIYDMIKEERVSDWSTACVLNVGSTSSNEFFGTITLTPTAVYYSAINKPTLKLALPAFTKPASRKLKISAIISMAGFGLLYAMYTRGVVPSHRGFYIQRDAKITTENMEKSWIDVSSYQALFHRIKLYYESKEVQSL